MEVLGKPFPSTTRNFPSGLWIEWEPPFALFPAVPTIAGPAVNVPSPIFVVVAKFKVIWLLVVAIPVVFVDPDTEKSLEVDLVSVDDAVFEIVRSAVGAWVPIPTRPNELI